MKLIIAEKPSVAMQIANVLNIREKHDGYLQNDQYIVSWCYGHLVELSQADEYDESLKRWDLEQLPIIPEKWKINVIEDKKQQFSLLKKLMEDQRVQSLICATDSGREGELIFRFVYEKAECKKPFERLWVSSLENQAIKEGFENLRDGKDFDPLYDSAIARAKADWLVGINATRLFSCLYRHPLHVGRVQSPTLAMVAERDEKIASFQKEKSYKVKLDFDGWDAESAAYPSMEEANEVKTTCEKAQAVFISSEEKEKTLQPPTLFDLTTLQRTANRLYGYTAKETLAAAQALYESKLITYPRTDSKYITSDMEKSIPDLLDIAFVLFGQEKQKLDTTRLVDDSKVQDHFALLPTKNLGKADLNSLSKIEKDILNLITAQLLIACSDKHSSKIQTANIICGDIAFTAKGKTILQDGWKAMERQLHSKTQEEKEEKTLPELVHMQQLPIRSIIVTEHESSPPKPYTEDTLLAAMETAGKSELDKSLAHEKSGLGTAATRASLIEKLLATGSVERKNKQILSTQKGRLLVQVLPNQLKSASLTASWENQLIQIASGTMPLDIFLNGTIALTQEIVQTKHAQINPCLFQFDKESIGFCPRCGGSVFESKKNFYCENKECKFVMWKEDRFFTDKKTTLTKKAAHTLLEKGKVQMKNLHSPKTGKTYDAFISLDISSEKYTNYSLQF